MESYICEVCEEVIRDGDIQEDVEGTICKACWKEWELENREQSREYFRSLL